MPDPETRAWRPQREHVLWLAGALALVVAPHLPRLPLWLGAGFLGALAWRYAQAAGRLPPMSGWLRLLLIGATLGGVVAHYGTVLGREAGVALLVGLSAMKLIETRTLRDAYVVAFLGFFLVVTGFLFSQSIPIGLYMLAAVLALTATLVTLTVPPARLPRRARLRLAGRLLAQAAPVALALFVLFPRVPGPLWGLPKDAYGAVTGLSETMSPGSISSLGASDAVVFRVSFTGTPPPASALYWRGPVLWRTDGRTWRTLSRGTSRDSPVTGDAADAVDHLVTLEPHQQRWLFALELPESVPEGAVLSEDFELLAARPVRELTRYPVRSFPGYRIAQIDGQGARAALQLPRGWHARARRLAAQWRDEAGRDRDIVARALAHFRSEPFHYTLSPPRLEGDPVDEFLFETRRGFCEHYAAAFTVLMRAAGVPARVVTGYQGGEMNPLGDYLIVRQRDAHAWAEVWLAGEGWVRVDPTAAVSPVRIEAGMEAALPDAVGAGALGLARSDALARFWRALRHGWDSVNNGWNQWVLGYGPSRQASLLSRLGLDRQRLGQLAAALAAAVGAPLALVAWWLWRRSRPRDPVQRAWLRFCARLARRGLARRAHEGPLDFARRARRRRPDLAGQIDTITGLYVALRYGDAAADRRALGHAVARFRP